MVHGASAAQAQPSHVCSTLSAIKTTEGFMLCLEYPPQYAYLTRLWIRRLGWSYTGSMLHKPHFGTT
ncbi:hypothetical protein DPMN_010511 [Dreissena polymorpha]|uniref:Uncharacterized protein n=1 Tax=Dreissena polymorpha TaxID=45954 RepID=A0A9D4RZB3_DREPO|nr:hypothetical protein DPMN_010511 [Dreissena polymorpha]